MEQDMQTINRIIDIRERAEEIVKELEQFVEEDESNKDD